jgi:putative N6-adenine-specific DNA methylase
VLVKANLWLRTANKVYIVLDEFTTDSFDELFDRIYGIDWEFWI